MVYDLSISPEAIVRTMRGVIDKFLIPKFMSLGMNATGDWISSLEARAYGLTGEIWGLDYTEYLVNGRAPGKRPPITPLVRWASAKFGISGQEAISTAFAVANKIAAEGTNYYPQGTDLLEILQSNQVEQYIYTELAAELNGKIQLNIVRMANEILI